MNREFAKKEAPGVYYYRDATGELTDIEVDEIEQLKAKIQDISEHYRYTLQNIEDHLAMSNASDTDLREAYDRIIMSMQWLRKNHPEREEK